ncbi:MAG: quinone oxidoreductase [Myxococcales bacterium]|nr:quinone oxidoreductase [Myxococcales bacterium]
MKSRAIRIREPGASDRLELAEIDVPEPGAGEVRVAISTAGVNYIDTYQRSGLYRVPLPFTLGLEGAGRVEAVGDGVTRWCVGDRVAWAMAPGSYADAMLVPAERLVALPDAVSEELAAATLLQGMTAHYLAHGVRETRPGDVALVHAAAGGTGGLLVQMLVRAGARVIATCGTMTKAELARTAGASDVILYDEEDFAARTRALTDGRGVDVVYDAVGRATFEGSLASLRSRGLLCLYGQASGPVPPFDLNRLNDLGSLFVTRPSLGHYVADRASLEGRADAVFEALARGELVQRIGARHPLEAARRAHDELESRATTGKLVLTTGNVA